MSWALMSFRGGLQLPASVRLILIVAFLAISGPAVAFPNPAAAAPGDAPCDDILCPEPPPPPGAPPDPGGAFPKVVQQLAIVGAAAPGGTLYLASDVAPNPHYWIWQIEPMCDVLGGDCTPGQYCAGAGQGVYMDINVQALAQPGIATPGNANPPPVAPPVAPGRPSEFKPPPPGIPAGTPYTGWLGAGQGCVDVSQLNVPPTPEEVLEVFITLPIPGLGFQVQPPDLGLVNLPEIYFTTEATTGVFTFDIRGFGVVLDTEVAQYVWHTGDTRGPTGIPEIVSSTGPGLPYPNQYVTHTYLQRGDYTATLETLWQGAYSVDGGPRYGVPGSVTTTGPARTISVVEAQPVLTDPYD